MNIDFSDILRRTAGYRGLDRGSDIVETCQIEGCCSKPKIFIHVQVSLYRSRFH